MKLYSVFTTLLLVSSALSIAVPPDSDGTTVASNDSGVEDGVAPAFDPQEFTADESMVNLDERDLDNEYSDALAERGVGDEYSEELDKRSSGSAIVQCATKLKGTKYLFNGCKSTAPFGPAKNGIGNACLARTCVKKATKTTIRKLLHLLLKDLQLTGSSTNSKASICYEGWKVPPTSTQVWKTRRPRLLGVWSEGRYPTCCYSCPAGICD